MALYYICGTHGKINEFKPKFIQDEYGFYKSFATCPKCDKPVLVTTKIPEKGEDLDES